MIRWLLAIFVVLSAGLMLLGCPAPAAVCTHLTTRCADNIVQICDSNGQWEVVTDCEGVASGQHLEWSCVQDMEGDHVCLPAE